MTRWLVALVFVLLGSIVVAESVSGPDRSAPAVRAGTCRVEPSNTPSGFEVVLYPRDAWSVPAGWAVPCP